MCPYSPTSNIMSMNQTSQTTKCLALVIDVLNLLGFLADKKLMHRPHVEP